MALTFEKSYGIPGLGQQVPFQRSVEPTSLGTFVNLEQRDMNRMRRYEERWRMYLGQQWTFQREDGEPLFTGNIIRSTLDRGISWLVGNGFKFNIAPKFADIILPHLVEAWERTNDKMVVLLEAAQMASVCGDVFLMVAPEEPSESAKNSNPYTKTLVRIHVLGSESVFPVWDPLNTEKMLAVKLVTLFVDQTNIEGTRQDTPLNVRRFIQVITPTTVTEYMQGSEPTTRVNPLGEIPIVHIKNIGLAREYYGLSDMDGGLIDLQRELNEKATDVSDTLNYHAHPITVIIGAKVKNLERGPKKIWSGFPVGTEVMNLQMQGDMSASMDFMKYVRDLAREVTEDPKPVEGGISNTSAAALQMQFLPTVQRNKRKKPYYERGIREVNYFILRWLQVMDDLFLPYGFCACCGGRTLDALVFDREGNPLKKPSGKFLLKRRCFEADPATGQFLHPDDLKLLVTRKTSKGTKREMVERWRLVASLLGGRPSFWDPWGEAKNTGEILSEGDAQDQARSDEEEFRNQTAAAPVTTEEPEPEEPDEFGNVPPPPPPPEGFDLDVTLLEIPAEPEIVMVIAPLTNPDGSPMLDGAGQPITAPQELFLVPTRCERPELFNPLAVDVELNDALPQDEQLTSALANQNVMAGLWSKKRAMMRMNIESPEREMEDIRVEREEGNGPADATDVPRTPLQGMEKERGAFNGGNPNKPMPAGVKKPFGKNQGES